MEYVVTYYETVAHTVVVTAENEHEAFNKSRNKMGNFEIIKAPKGDRPIPFTDYLFKSRNALWKCGAQDLLDHANDLRLMANQYRINYIVKGIDWVIEEITSKNAVHFSKNEGRYKKELFDYYDIIDFHVNPNTDMSVVHLNYTVNQLIELPDKVLKQIVIYVWSILDESCPSNFDEFTIEQSYRLLEQYTPEMIDRYRGKIVDSIVASSSYRTQNEL